jgi:DNA-binding Xre family transcriptional regulator
MAIKAEHNGAKNGGGHYGPRADAKEMSNHVRREDAKAIVRASKVVYQPTSPVAEFVDEYGDTQIVHRPRGRSLRVFRGLNTPALRLNRAVSGLMGERIKARRLELGLSLKEVAFRAGMQTVSPKQYIHSIETAKRGEGVRLGTLFALAYALECEPADLLPAASEVMKLAEVTPEEFKALAA